MRAHVIKNGIVVNSIEVESLDFMEGIVDGTSQGKIGDRYEDGEFISPDLVIEETPVLPTKEELLAQLQALQGQIESLGE